MTYNVVEGLVYYYTNDTISVGTGYRYVQPVADVGESYSLVGAMDVDANWTKIDDFTNYMNQRSPTIPNIAGTATIVLSPHTIPNWNAFDDGTGQDGLNPIYTGDMPAGKRAKLDVEGQICPNKMGSYRVDRIGVQVLPMSTEVDYATLLDKDGAGKDSIVFQAIEKELKEGIKAVAQQQAQQPRRAQLPTLKAPVPAAGTAGGDRNASTDVKDAVVYGSTMTFESSSSADDDENEHAIAAFPWYYDGVYAEIISYVENPNIIWKMRHSDFIGGGQMNIRNSTESITFTINAPKPVGLAKTIKGIDEVKGKYENDWVNVMDENVCYGAIAFTVPKAFRNVVATRPYIAATEGADGKEATKEHLGLSPKNIGFCYLSWSFTFRTM